MQPEPATIASAEEQLAERLAVIVIFLVPAVVQRELRRTISVDKNDSASPGCPHRQSSKFRQQSYNK